MSLRWYPLAITIYDIARDAEVSIATVSRVLNEHPRVAPETRERVLRVSRDLGYQPHSSAQSLARNKASLVSAVIPMMANSFFIEVLRGVQAELASSQFDLLVYSARTVEEVDGQLERAMHRGRSAGLMLFSSPATEARVHAILEGQLPAVLVDSFHPEVDSVSVDNEHGAYIATRHIFDQGAATAGLVTAHPRSVPAQHRRRGYERALEEHEVTLNEDLIVVCDDNEDGFSEEAAYAAVRQFLMRRKPPDAFFATSDVQALGVLRALREAGFRVPEDVALVGFDDVPFVQYVGLTTLRQPMYEIGKTAIRKLLSRIEHPEDPVSHTVFAPRLVVRETSKRTGKVVAEDAAHA